MGADGAGIASGGLSLGRQPLGPECRYGLDKVGGQFDLRMTLAIIAVPFTQLGEALGIHLHALDERALAVKLLRLVTPYGHSTPGSRLIGAVWSGGIDPHGEAEHGF